MNIRLFILLSVSCNSILSSPWVRASRIDFSRSLSHARGFVFLFADDASTIFAPVLRSLVLFLFDAGHRDCGASIFERSAVKLKRSVK